MSRRTPLAAALLVSLALSVLVVDVIGEKPEYTTESFSNPLGWHGKVITVSEAGPRAFLYKNFLTPEECDHLIDKALPKLEPATVVDNDSGDSYSSPVRTSSNTFFTVAEDDVIARIEKRIASITHIPVSHGEGIQILRYINGEKYDAHYDYFHDVKNSARSMGGQRVATLLMYLKTVPVHGGGETVFPDAKHGQASGEEWSDCAKGKLAVKTERGDALLFFNLFPDSTKDPSSLHASCPTTAGEKYSATKWMHLYPIGGGCFNGHENCQFWADHGECDKNTVYMHAECREACGLCKEDRTT
mmetsp:Transcript_36975/g.104366  ORF Transcript_36975/g.104366 Transcript_36975/m.104366 type:complete len:302 (-) Transcript_36975:159-1064(-)|eukprot:CAMPEP_0117675088 /NCGR_PEP_ID=MMETSP0804-20121206/15410_1 /TAXON_ID=1074897 /ORGANISM="Tetraselmis astigmatica, Strain CCMP880" /LENGTH=301 /DNA_ID=CAMNT_0005484051 /DNA_START=131 /DNA_END=1036 /DNA_ORIENTATION=-